MGTYLFVHEEKELFRREEPIQSCGQAPFSIRHAINQTVLISVINMYVLFSEMTAVVWNTVFKISKTNLLDSFSSQMCEIWAEISAEQKHSYTPTYFFRPTLTESQTRLGWKGQQRSSSSNSPAKSRITFH